uniref:Katanin_con80 domain-containing protein n=1 Tax=Strongyloides venezuelensis TaxID=75913 RepID=A0A0K0G0T2_STRVS
MESAIGSSSLKKDNSLSYMGSASSSLPNSSMVNKSKNGKKYSSKNNNYPLRNRSSSVGNFKGKQKDDPSNNVIIHRNRSMSRKDKSHRNDNPTSDFIVPRFRILSKNCISTNERDLEQLDIISSKILKDGLGIILSFKFRNNYFSDIIEEVTLNEKLWCIESVELIMPQLLALIMSKSIKNKISSLKIIQRIIRDFSDAISSDDKKGKKIKQYLLQILVNEPMILINTDKIFQKDMAFVVKQINSL